MPIHHSKHIHGPLEDRFWPKVDKSPGHGPNGDCWPWTGGKVHKGYGKINDGTGKTAAAHRVAWLLTNGVWPRSPLLHSCDVPACCNPSHLNMGTLAENNEDMRRKGRKYSKLTREQAEEIKVTKDGTYKAIAARYGISSGLVSHIKNGRAWI